MSVLDCVLLNATPLLCFVGGHRFLWNKLLCKIFRIRKCVFPLLGTLNCQMRTSVTSLWQQVITMQCAAYPGWAQNTQQSSNLHPKLAESAYLTTKLRTPQAWNSKKGALGLHSKAVLCSWRGSMWNTIKQDKDVDHQFWISTQAERRSFSTKVSPKKVNPTTK